MLLLLRVVFFSKQMEYRMQSLRRHCAWQHKSYPSLLSSWLDVITLSSRETILNFETKNCKRNENTEIKDLTTEEIKEKIETEKAALTKMKMNHAVSPLENPMLIRTTRRNIARLMTELRKRELNK